MTTANSITVKSLDIIKGAMFELGSLAAGETPNLDDQAWVLQKLQRLIDRYNAREPMIYNVNFSRFTLPIGVSPVTIGPGANFDISQRPVKIYSASLILVTGNAQNEIDIPMNLRDDDWWANQAIKGLESTLPTDLYYSPSWPNGQLYFWPIPTAVNDVRLETRQILTEVRTYNADFSMPPAYWDLMVYELAISLAPGFEKEPSPTLLALWKQALKAVQVNNISSPRLASDAPTDSHAESIPSWSFLTGLSTNQ